MFWSCSASPFDRTLSPVHTFPRCTRVRVRSTPVQAVFMASHVGSRGWLEDLDLPVTSRAGVGSRTRATNSKPGSGHACRALGATADAAVHRGCSFRGSVQDLLLPRHATSGIVKRMSRIAASANGLTMTRAALIAALLLLLPALAAAESPRPQTATPVEPAPFVIAEASCASLCSQRHNQCRISTRGSPRCDAELQRCLKGCLASKGR